MRKIGIIIGSKSDLKQCKEGLEFLEQHSDKAMLLWVRIISQHRNTLEIQKLLTSLSNIPISTSSVDALIIGAGWANHLTGCSDAFLRYTLRNLEISVIGVAFEDLSNRDHTQAATLSITEVPKTQVIHQNESGRKFIGPSGFLNACQFAATKELPEIEIPEPVSSLTLTLTQALKIAREEKEKT